MDFMGTVKTLLTFEEFEQLPDQPGKQELVRGELIEMPPADYKHHLIADRICDSLKSALLQAHARGEAGDLGRVFREMGYRLPGEGWLQPDVSVTHAGQRVEKYLVGAPAIAIEVISPSNTAKQIDAKAALYLEFGAREVWRLLPKKKQVMIQAPGSVRVIAEDSAITTPLLPGLALAVKELFGD
jgi:Uma2 family endonuclease